MLKMRVSGRYSLITLCNFVFKRPDKTLFISVFTVKVQVFIV
jgi:hypothetical protein